MFGEAEVKRPDNYDDITWADVDSPPTLRTTDVWFGIYLGIRFEINRFKLKFYYKPDDCWTYYIYISIDDQLPDEMKEFFWLPPKLSGGRERLTYDYYESIISKLEFHGGCTWYSKESSPDDKKRIIKVGCDYQHLWDEGKHYDLEGVYSEVKETIDSLWGVVGDIKIRSNGDGKYRLLSEYTTSSNIT